MTSETLELRVVQTKHYATLDGLRGFAAISVVLFHLGHWLHAPWLATNSHLAVDFFFCLSGFVLPVAYERRLRTTMSTVAFLRIRLIRLLPLTVLATCVSALYVTFRSRLTGTPVSDRELLVATLLGLINLPFLFASTDIGGPQVFPLNGPQYSLFLEIVINTFWSFTRRVSGLWQAAAIVVICLALLPTVGLGGDEASTFWSGFPRVGASFFAGVLVYHFERHMSAEINLSKSFVLLTCGTITAFFYTGPLPLAVHLGMIVLLFPLIILAGVRTPLTGILRNLALLGGAISYPMYALHYPIFCWTNGLYQFATKKPPSIFVEGPFLFLAILMGSYFLLKVYDGPIRAALTHTKWSVGSRKVRAVRRP